MAYLSSPYVNILNCMIPRVLQIQVADTTNGLRRHSTSATKLIVRVESVNKGYIYSFEQTLELGQCGIPPKEIPIVFESRIAAESSVTFRDLLDSLVGLFAILKMKFAKGMVPK